MSLLSPKVSSVDLHLHLEVGPSNIFNIDYKLQVLSRIFSPLTLRPQMFRNKSCFYFLKIPLSYPPTYHVLTKNKFLYNFRNFQRQFYLLFFHPTTPRSSPPPHPTNFRLPFSFSSDNKQKQARILKKTLPQKHKITISETIVYKKNTSRIYFIKCPNKAT